MSTTPSQTLRLKVAIASEHMEYADNGAMYSMPLPDEQIDAIIAAFSTYLDEQQLPNIDNKNKTWRKFHKVGYNQAIAEQLERNKEGLR